MADVHQDPETPPPPRRRGRRRVPDAEKCSVKVDGWVPPEDAEVLHREARETPEGSIGALLRRFAKELRERRKQPKS